MFFGENRLKNEVWGVVGSIKTEDRRQKTERGGQKNCQKFEKNLAKTIAPVLQ